VRFNKIKGLKSLPLSELTDFHKKLIFELILGALSAKKK